MWAGKRAGAPEKWRGHVMSQYWKAVTKEMASRQTQQAHLHPCSFSRPQIERDFSHGISKCTSNSFLKQSSLIIGASNLFLKTSQEKPASSGSKSFLSHHSWCPSEPVYDFWKSKRLNVFKKEFEQ